MRGEGGWWWRVKGGRGDECDLNSSQLSCLGISVYQRPRQLWVLIPPEASSKVTAFGFVLAVAALIVFLVSHDLHHDKFDLQNIS